MKQLTNKETNELAEVCQRIDNFRCVSLEKMMLLQGWYRLNGLAATGPIKDKTKKLIELLGCKYNCRKVYEGLNSVWGFSFDEKPYNKFIFYHDFRGIALEVHPKFRKDQLVFLVDELIEILCVSKKTI